MANVAWARPVHMASEKKGRGYNTEHTTGGWLHSTYAAPLLPVHPPSSPTSCGPLLPHCLPPSNSELVAQTQQDFPVSCAPRSCHCPPGRGAEPSARRRPSDTAVLSSLQQLGDRTVRARTLTLKGSSEAKYLKEQEITLNMSCLSLQKGYSTAS